MLSPTNRFDNEVRKEDPSDTDGRKVPVVYPTMQNRILDLSDAPARLRIRDGRLVVERESHPPAIFSLADVSVLVVANPRVTFTQAVLAGLAGAGGVFVACDGRNLPVAMLLPLQGNSLQAERFAAQAAARLPLRKRLWRQLVRAKIEAQASVLVELCGDDAGLMQLSRLVRSGDRTNIEARASRRYWPLLFDDDGFRRRRDRNDQNRLLNYGYAVLRAIVARAICAAGLHPTLGLHHHNRYNAFCLADDLMEPYRPVVDLAVARHFDRDDGAGGLNRETKARLLEALIRRCSMDGEQRTLFDAASRTATSLAAVYMGERDRLDLPESLVDAST